MALQAVYQWLMSGGTARAIERQYVDDSPIKKADLDFFHELPIGRYNFVPGEIRLGLAILLRKATLFQQSGSAT